MATFELPIQKLPITIKYLESYEGDIIDKFLRTDMSFDEAVNAVNLTPTETEHNGFLRCQKQYNTFICYKLDKVNKKETEIWQIGMLNPGKKKKIYIHNTYNIDKFFNNTIINNIDYVCVARSHWGEDITISADTKGIDNVNATGWSPNIMGFLRPPGGEGQNLNEQRELVLRF